MNTRPVTMSGADAAWLHMDRPRNLMVVTTILRLDGRPDWDAVRNVLARRVVDRFPRFRQRAVDPPVTFGLISPSWRDDSDFRLDHHVSHLRSESLTAHLAGRAAEDLDPGRPQWHADLVDLPSGSAVVLRTHHALADGAGLVRVIMAATDAETAGAPSGLRARPAPVDDGAIERQVAALVKLGSRPFRRGADGMPLTATLSGEKSVAQIEPVTVDALKERAGATKATVNDVYLAAITGALREHLGPAVGDAPDLDVIMPVSVRKPDEAEPLGNRFGLVVVALPVGVEDPHERRTVIARRTRVIKASVEAEVVSRGLSTMGRIPRAAQQAWVDRFIGDAVAVVTNVAGPPKPVTLADTPVSNMSLLVPSTGPIGLGVSLFSYAGRATASIIADRATMPDCAPFASALGRELHEGETGARRTRRRRRAARQ